MGKNCFKLFTLLAFILTLLSCKAFKHGYTWNKARNSYHLITGNENNFGDKRLDYNKGFHRNSALSHFLDCRCNDRGLPSFIFEYETEAECRGIKFFYIQRDSVFIFEEPKKGNLQSVLREARKMDDSERQTYIKLKEGK